MTSSETRSLAQQVQRNCDISDARYGGNYSLCIYLLKMREFYRWEQGFNYAQTLAKEEVGDWLAAREGLWESLANEQDYRPLQIDGEAFAIFDNQAINARLNPHGLVYSAGLGIHGASHFVLARLDEQQTHDDYQISISGKELARDLTSPPAMSLDQQVLIRRESLRRSLWERVDGWNWNRPKNAMSRALTSYPWQDDIDAALDTMTDDQMNAVIQHEIGEVLAGQLVGSDWQDMVYELRQSKAELVLRAIRDHLADALTTLPHLIASQDAISLHLYIANLNNMRKHLYPSLLASYEQWLKDNNWQALEDLNTHSRDTWLELAQHCLAEFSVQGHGAKKSISELSDLQQV